MIDLQVVTRPARLAPPAVTPQRRGSQLGGHRSVTLELLHHDPGEPVDLHAATSLRAFCSATHAIVSASTPPVVGRGFSLRQSSHAWFVPPTLRR
jgi:hypothetical protein